MLSNGAQFGIGLAIAFSVGHLYLPALMRKRPARKPSAERGNATTRALRRARAPHGLERLGASGVEVR